MLAGGAAFLIGLALMVLPEVLPAVEAGADLFQVIGPIAGALGFVSLTEVTRGVRRLTVLPALVLAVGSLIVGMPPVGIAIGWVAAGMLALSGLPAGGRRSRYAGGWRSLLD